MPLANSRLASILGRPDLSAVPLDPYSGTTGGFQAGAGISSALIAGNVDTSGRITAGLLGLALIGVVAFYLWTRDLQA